jgi:hypothetical protein
MKKAAEAWLLPSRSICSGIGRYNSEAFWRQWLLQFQCFIHRSRQPNIPGLGII